MVEENAEFDVHKLKDTLENNFLKTINVETDFFFLTKLSQNDKIISRKLVEEKFYFSEGETSFFWTPVSIDIKKHYWIISIVVLD